MKSAILCLVFILTNAVLAQASEGVVSTQKWITNYSAETEVNGLPVRANLDILDFGVQSPEAIGSRQTLAPSLLPVIKHNFRLNLVVSESPRIDFTYEVQPRMISIDGATHYAYVSNLDDKNAQFVITTMENGSLHVSYTQQNADGAAATGEFTLVPVPHIL